MGVQDSAKVMKSEARAGFCPACGKDVPLIWYCAEDPLEIRGKTVLVQMTYCVCKVCGEVYDEPLGRDCIQKAEKQVGYETKAKSELGDYLGLAFFAFAAILAGLAAWEHPTLLAWLSVVHNALLAGVYALRRPVKGERDRPGLLLGLLAAAMPLASTPDSIPPGLMGIGLAGYGFTLWSLLLLGKSFGIAPADRGLVRGGPYRIVRHPMYLGELIFRGVMVAADLNLLNGLLLAALTIVQVARIRREERIIAGYERYEQETRWRLAPGIW